MQALRAVAAGRAGRAWGRLLRSLEVRVSRPGCPSGRRRASPLPRQRGSAVRACARHGRSGVGQCVRGVGRGCGGGSDRTWVGGDHRGDGLGVEAGLSRAVGAQAATGACTGGRGARRWVRAWGVVPRAWWRGAAPPQTSTPLRTPPRPLKCTSGWRLDANSPSPPAPLELPSAQRAAPGLNSSSAPPGSGPELEARWRCCCCEPPPAPWSAPLESAPLELTAGAGSGPAVPSPGPPQGASPSPGSSDKLVNSGHELSTEGASRLEGGPPRSWDAR